MSMGGGVIKIRNRGSGQNIDILQGGNVRNFRNVNNCMFFDLDGGTHFQTEPDGNISITDLNGNDKRGVATEDDDDDVIPPDNKKVKKEVIPLGTVLPDDLTDAKAEEAKEEKEECMVCNTFQKVITFVPCGHLAVCIPCVKKLWSDAFPERITCVCCRKPVDSTVRTYV